MPSQKIFLSILVGLICVGLSLCVSGWAQPPQQQEEIQAAKDDASEEIKPAPKDIKEAIGIYVFLGWIWISIFVLIYILCQKIKEADRIYRLKFFSSVKK
ncbi:MAG: hypothetical protein GQ545_08845 [Candidatus Aminicenantes bacterium]|nr:hypothetical protein [Candidatus Aminicenantes bacterium]